MSRIVKICPQAGTLREQVSEKVSQAERTYLSLTNSGMDRIRADEMRLDTVAPALSHDYNPVSRKPAPGFGEYNIYPHGKF